MMDGQVQKMKDLNKDSRDASVMVTASNSKNMLNAPNSDEEINVRDVFSTLALYKKPIGAITLFVTIIGAIIAFTAPKFYKAELSMRPSKLYSAKSSGSSSSQGLGAIGALMGVSLGGEQDADSKLNMVTASSRTFNEWVVRRYNLAQILGPANKKNVQYPIEELEKGATEILMDSVKLAQDPKTSILKIESKSKDPVMAAMFAMVIFRSINDYTKDKEIAKDRMAIEVLNRELERNSLVEVRQVLFSLIADKTRQMALAETQQDYAFEMIDPPLIPESPFGPGKLYKIAVSFLIGLVIAMATVLGFRVLTGKSAIVNSGG
jgi:uncharacterized protein involved in exopolysaccharide biosynthesis